MDGKRGCNQKLPPTCSGRTVGVAGEDAIASIPVIVVELPVVDIPLTLVGIPVDIHDEASDIVPKTIRTTAP